VATTASTTSGRTRPAASNVPTVPLCRPSVTTSAAPASRSARHSAGHWRAACCSPGALEPTSASTVNPRRAAVRISSRLARSSISTVPLDTSTCENPAASAQSRQAVARPWAQAISSRVPPRQLATACVASIASLAGSAVST
jgi:hypothetical protein